MLLLIFSEPAYQFWFVRQPRDYSREKHQLDSILASMKWARDSTSVDAKRKFIELFDFDPNLSSKEDLIRLGFKQALANRIINYRAKGGRFVTKNDLRKIYGLDSTFFVKISAHVKLPEASEKTVIKTLPKSPESDKPTTTKFDLNTADTTQFIKIYGIGSKLAKRIVIYRSKLGGFIFGGQLSEVYGLDSTVVNNLLSRSFVADNFRPTQINVNLASEKELGAHPYIKYKIAKAIVAYRMQHGALTSLDDLKKITIIEDADFNRMRPYLLVQ